MDDSTFALKHAGIFLLVLHYSSISRCWWQSMYWWQQL